MSRDVKQTIVCVFLVASIQLSSNVTADNTKLGLINQTQVFMRSDLASYYNTLLHFIGKFKVLQQSYICSQLNINSCHSNEYSYELYFGRCYSNVCAKEKYFCLNSSNSTLHICGRTENCKKRARNIVVYNTTGSDYVDVYSVGCPDGYFQSNKGNCFTQCLTDESIVLVTSGRAYCNSQKNYCNRKGVKWFELGSEEDDCVDAAHDLGKECDQTEELLPDCSCEKKCLPGEERDWNGLFQCNSISKSGDKQENTSILKSTHTSASNPSQQTSPKLPIRKDMNSTDENLKVKDVWKQIPDDNQSDQHVSVVLVLPGAVGVFGLLVMFVLVGLFFKPCRNHSRDQISHHTTSIINHIYHSDEQPNRPSEPLIPHSETSKGATALHEEYPQPQMDYLKIRPNSGTNPAEQNV